MSLNYKQNDELIPLYQSGISPDQMDKTETDANNCVPIDTDIKVYRVGNSAINIPIQQAGIIESFVYRDSGNVRVTQRYTVNYNTSGTPTFSRTAIGDDNSLTWSAWSTFDNYSTDEQVVGRWIDGKPIYRKIATIPNLTTTTYSATSLGINDVETMTNISGYMTNSTYSHIGVGTNFASGYSVTVVYKTNGTFQTELTGYASGKLTLIAEYTKSTD